ncbi:MAG: electron transfer flavoprotein subunit alpha/FixB family protein [Peptococcaceae bacterium]
MNRIWIISDMAETAYEMISKALELKRDGGSIAAYLIGREEEGQKAVQYGADHVKLMDLPAETAWEQYGPVLAEEAKAVRPDLILIGASRRGKDLAAQLGALLDVPCVTECKSLEPAGDKIVLERIIYGGLAEKKLACVNSCVIATIASRTFNKSEQLARDNAGSITKLILPQETKLKVIERRPKPQETVNIGEANTVVGVGRGFAGKEELGIAEELKEALKGEIGCTRPIAEDLHWLPEDRYIGISGQVVRPTLYLAAGVSGQVQHVYGIRDAKVIVAVDKNENAPIFQVADYYLVGDLKEVLPAFTKAVKQVKGH